MHAPLDPDGRDYKNLYKIVLNNDLTDILNEGKFSSFFSDFNQLIENEKKFYEKSQN